MELGGIKNIIFDLGGVILNINPYLTYEEFSKFGLGDIVTLKNNPDLKRTLQKHETGELETDELYDCIRELAGNHKITNEEIKKAWNAMILDIPVPRIKLLSILKNRYRTFLLSNTNELHLEYYNANLQKEQGIANLSVIFEKDYYSHLMGMRKPNEEIYDKILKDNDLVSEETLFIDDFEINIKGAQKLGIKTYLKDARKELVELFDVVALK
jgi:glucose-1-phosphatase